MQPPDDLTVRDMVSGMPLAFNPREAQGLRAVVQFCFSGADPGDYHLHIADGVCTFHEGRDMRPDVTIHAASEVWLDICYGRLDGTAAYLLGRYRAEGNILLLLRLRKIFPG